MKSALRHTKWSRAGWVLAVAASLLLVLGAVLPLVVGAEGEVVVRNAFRHLCHQIPGRSFVVDGTPLTVCHRCTGIYAGLVLGTLALPLIRSQAQRWATHDRWVLLAAVLPAVIDWGGDVLGVWSNTAATRVVTGLWLGAIVGFVFARSLAFRRKADAGAIRRAQESAGVA